MNRIEGVYRFIFRIWRPRRWKWFVETIHPVATDVILDVGGVPEQWLAIPQTAARIECLNIDKINWDDSQSPGHRITSVIGDGCNLGYTDKSYDILFSNSVIEHVGDWEHQQRFAHEVRRVGRKLWIQTPAFECPLEPHFLAPFVHWLPKSVRRRILRWMTPWGWIERPDQAKIDQTIATTRLLTKRQLKELFPDCNIRTERLFILFRKSYIAWRV